MEKQRFIRLSWLAIALGCGDAAVAPSMTDEVFLAQGGPPATQKVDFTITDAGMSLTSDGKGIYQNGICGVVGTWQDILHMAPTGASIPKNQKAACTGIAPRGATLTLAVRHLSDNPHIDDAGSPAGSGAWAVQNVKFGWSAPQQTTINAAPSCGASGVGMRFASAVYPGSDDVVRHDLGGGLWHMYTRPWPDNKAYCKIGGVATYWHVSLDLNVQIVGS